MPDDFKNRSTRSENINNRVKSPRSDHMIAMVQDLHTVVVGSPMDPKSGLVNRYNDFEENVMAELLEIKEKLSVLESDKKAITWIIRAVSAALALLGITNWPQISAMIYDFIKK